MAQALQQDTESKVMKCKSVRDLNVAVFLSGGFRPQCTRTQSTVHCPHTHTHRRRRSETPRHHGCHLSITYWPRVIGKREDDATQVEALNRVAAVKYGTMDEERQ